MDRLVGALMPAEVEQLPPVQKAAVKKLRRGYLAGMVTDARLRYLHLLTPAELASEMFEETEMQRAA